MALHKAGCGIRPSKKGFCGADLHHRIDLNFDDNYVLVSAKNMPRNGPKMTGWTFEMYQSINTCVEEAIAASLGKSFAVEIPIVLTHNNLTFYVFL